MKRMTMFAVLLTLLVTIAYVPGYNRAEASFPRRIEVSVTSQDAPVGQSRITLRWEKSTSYVLQRMESIDANGNVNWTTLTYLDDPDFADYSRYTAVVPNYQNYVFRVGSGTLWQQARVYPPNENAHANYAHNSDTCKGCHRTHYAAHRKLLSQSIILNLCLTCHGDGTGSKYNVLTGTVRTGLGEYSQSPAGAFGRGDGTVNVTSYHNVFREEAGTEMLAPGGEMMALTCTDCHNAHVTPTSSPFRLLKHRPGQNPVDAYAVTQNGEYKTVYRRYMNDFCSQCHDYYNYNSHAIGEGITEFLRPDLQNQVTYRHPTDLDVRGWLSGNNLQINLPLEKRVESDNVARERLSCITCHFAHGTTMRGWQVTPEPYVIKIDRFGNEVYLHESDLTADELQAYLDAGYALEGGYIVAPDDSMLPVSTMLKRGENMSICLECHLDIWANAPAGFF